MRKHNDQFNMDPWDPDYYETGSTQPPKSHGPLIGLLLMMIIFLCGISSAFGVLNAQPGDPAQSDTTQSPVSFQTNISNQVGTTAPTDASKEGHTTSTVPPATSSLELQTSPQSVDNVPQTGGMALQDIYAKAIDSVVSIACRTSTGSASGTGVILSIDGYIVTNAHVVDGAQTITVTLTDGRELAATLIGADGASDLAVLHVPAEDLTAAEFGDSSVLRVGDTVVAIGDPLGVELRGTMTDGIVSAINRDITIDGRTMTVIQTNAALNSGNSGGPLLNCYGQVIGINTMKIGSTVNTAGVEGLGFAIPSTTVKTIVNQLISQGYVSGRPSLGLSVESVPRFYQRYYGLPDGLYITDVEEGSPAAELGIQPGDVLVSVGGSSVSDVDTLSSLLYSYEAGDTVEIVIYRSRRQYALELTLGEVTK